MIGEPGSDCILDCLVSLSLFYMLASGLDDELIIGLAISMKIFPERRLFCVT